MRSSSYFTHAFAARFRILRPSSRVRINYRIGAGWNNNVRKYFPVCVRHAPLTGTGRNLPGTVNSTILVLNSNGSRQCPLGIIPMICRYESKQMRNADTESSRRSRTIINSSNIHRIGYLNRFIQRVAGSSRSIGRSRIFFSRIFYRGIRGGRT